MLKKEPWFELYYFLEWYCEKWCNDNLYVCDFYADIWLSTGYRITDMLSKDFGFNVLSVNHRNLMDVLRDMAVRSDYTIRNSEVFAKYKNEYLTRHAKKDAGGVEESLTNLIKKIIRDENYNGQS